jgi:hypothetical protein
VEGDVGCTYAGGRIGMDISGLSSTGVSCSYGISALNGSGPGDNTYVEFGTSTWTQVIIGPFTVPSSYVSNQFPATPTTFTPSWVVPWVQIMSTDGWNNLGETAWFADPVFIVNT